MTIDLVGTVKSVFRSDRSNKVYYTLATFDGDMVKLVSAGELPGMKLESKVHLSARCSCRLGEKGLNELNVLEGTVKPVSVQVNE